MAIGTLSDFILDHASFLGGFQESVRQNLQVFGASSGSAIALESEFLPGEYVQEHYVPFVEGMAHRDPTSTADVEPLKISHADLISVKRNWRFGPFAHTLDSWAKQSGATTQEGLSFWFGRESGRQLLRDQINAALMGLVAASSGTADVLVDKSNETISHNHLVEAIFKFGDMEGAIDTLIMHSATYAQLLLSGIDAQIMNVSDVPIRLGQIPALGRQVIVTDSPALRDTDTSPDTYYVLCLQSRAATITISEQTRAASQELTGKANLVYQLQSEGAYNVKLRGFSWVDTSTPNPNDAALADPSNWVKKYTSAKDLPGVLLKVAGVTG